MFRLGRGSVHRQRRHILTPSRPLPRAGRSTPRTSQDAPPRVVCPWSSTARRTLIRSETAVERHRVAARHQQARERRRELVAQLDRRSDLGLGHDVAALAVRQHDAQNARSVPSRNSRQCSARAPHPHCLGGAAVSRVARPSYRRMFASTDRLRPFTLRPLSTDTAAPRVSRLREPWTAPAPRPLHRSRGLPDAPILRRRPRAPLPFHVAHSFHIERIRVNPTRPPGCAEGHHPAPSTSRSTLGGRPPDSDATRQALDALIAGDARISSTRRVG